MLTLNNEHSVNSDVDDTLLMWDYQSYAEEDRITIPCPYTGVLITYGIHRPHILLLHRYKARGYSITVWSKGGAAHAESACLALGLENIVDFVMAKPEKVLDDKDDLASIVGPVIFLPPY